MDLNKLCTTCQTIPLYDLLEETYALWTKDGPASQSKAWADWHSDLKALASASASCDLCDTVLHALQTDLRSQVYWCINFGDMSEEDGEEYSEGLLAVPKLRERHLQLELSYDSEGIQGGKAHAFLKASLNPMHLSSWEPGTLNASLRIVTSHELTLAQATIGRQVNEDPASEEAFSQINTWLDTCIRDHKNCPKGSASAPFPTRVLDVGDSQSDVVHLRKSDRLSESSGLYIALSHCWGVAPKMNLQTNNCSQPKDIPRMPATPENDLRASRVRRTTIKTLQEHMQGIAIYDLPQTVQDAILITRRLGVPYLWVDSLCIIQDDNEDWLQESAKMADVYLNAYLVIGASNSRADNNGFLSPRSRDNMIKFGRKHTDGRSVYLGLQILPPEPERWTRKVWPGDSTPDPVGQEPLASRAWCLQERYLARRMLLYGSSQLFWECAQLLAAEDGDFVPHSDYLRGLEETASVKPSIFDPRPDVDTITNYQRWYEMVTKYMICSLTNESDRLPALAGLATEVASSSGDEYLAGIWRNSIIEGLLWAKGQPDTESLKSLRERYLPSSSLASQSGPEALGKPENYRAPSWSWASVNGPVHFTVYKFPQRCRWKRWVLPFEALAAYVEHQITTEGLSPFGGIKDSYLRIRAPLLKVASIRTGKRNPLGHILLPFTPSYCSKLIGVSVGPEILFIEGGFDLDEYQTQDLSVLLLARLTHGQTATDQYYFVDVRLGLLVRETSQQGVYTRVGIVDGPVITGRNLPSPFMNRLNSVLAKAFPWKKKTEKWPVKCFAVGHAVTEEDGTLDTVIPDPIPEIERYRATITLI